MPKWKAWLLLGALSALTALLLWFGMAIVVRCEHVGLGRVDAIVERRLFGLICLSSETVTEITKADVYRLRGETSSAGRLEGGSTVALELTPKDGPVCRRTQFGPAFGTRPPEMAEEIWQFLIEQSRPTLTTWWMPWLVNLAALPFVLILGAFFGELLLRKLRVIKPEPVEMQDGA